MALVPSREAAAVVVAAFALAFAALYPQASPDPGSWGAARPAGGDERLLACGVLGGEPAFVTSIPFRTSFDTPSWSVALRVPAMDACVGGGLAAVAGSVGGMPAVAVVLPGGEVEAYRAPVFGNAVSVSCAGGRVAFAGATFTGDLLLGVVEPGGGGWAWLVPGPPGGAAWGARAAATPWGLVAVAGGLLYNASRLGVAVYSLPDLPGFNVTWTGASHGPGGLVVYGSAEGRGWAAAALLRPGAGLVLVNTSSHGGGFRAAYPLERGVLAYYTPHSWWDAVAYVPREPGGVYALRIVQGYPHSIAYARAGPQGFTVAAYDGGSDRLVCLVIPRLIPSIIGPPGDELAVVKPLPGPDALRAHREPLGPPSGPAPLPQATPIELEPVEVDVEEGGPRGNWTIYHSGLDRGGEALLGLALSTPIAALAYYSLGLDRLPARGRRVLARTPPAPPEWGMPVGDAGRPPHPAGRG